MTKKDLVKSVASGCGLTEKVAAQAVNTMIAAIVRNLRQRENVVVLGFGSFSVRERKARNGYNPATGKLVRIPSKEVVRFKPGKDLQFDGRIEKKVKK